VGTFAPNPIPSAYALHAPHPNPFNVQTRILLDLPKAGLVRLAVYDVQGKLCTTLLEGQLSAGRHEVSFDGGDFPSGIYLAKVEAGDFSEVQKMALVK
jgi:hypothetical protein